MSLACWVSKSMSKSKWLWMTFWMCCQRGSAFASGRRVVRLSERERSVRCMVLSVSLLDTQARSSVGHDLPDALLISLAAHGTVEVSLGR